MWALPSCQATRVKQGPTEEGHAGDRVKHFHQLLREEEPGLTARILRCNLLQLQAAGEQTHRTMHIQPFTADLLVIHVQFQNKEFPLV